MSLRDDIQADIAEAFDTDLADAVRSFTGSREVVGEYDPVTGTTGGTTVTYSGRGVFGSFRQDEIDGQHIIATDTKLTALQNELLLLDEQNVVTETQAEPRVNDDIDGQTVVAVQQDPAAATWTLALRRT